MKTVIIFLSLACLSFTINAQQTREVQTQNHFWWSLNTNAKLSKRWSIITDIHMRRTNFFKNNNFYFVRVGANYAITDKFSVAAGLGHMWLANKSSATELFSNENRIYQQALLNSSINKVSLIHRIRIEERWVQRVVNSIPTVKKRYSTRFRYLVSANIPISKNKKIPSVVVADELLLQMGKYIIYNPFDQNRFFAGIKQQVTKSLAFDFGYMHVYQQKSSGYQYSRNHTIRWFFYWQPDWRKKSKPTATAFQHSDDL